MKSVQNVSLAKFKVVTPQVPNSELLLDFSTLINEFKLSGDFLLIHWQARPKGYRQWGIYSSVDDSYRSVDELRINWSKVRSLQLDDKTANTIPSAVLLVENVAVTCINGSAIVGDVLLNDLT